MICCSRIQTTSVVSFLLLSLLYNRGCLSIALDEIVKNRTILCFGDSLTHGMYRNFSSLSNPYGHHPYMLALQRHFDSKQEQHVSVVELGVDGESVLSMTERLPTVLDSFNNIDIGNLRRTSNTILPEVQSSSAWLHLRSAYNHRTAKREAPQPLPVFVIILAGTNDISFQEPDLIINNIIQLHTITQMYAQRWSVSVYSIAVSIPELNDIGSGTSTKGKARKLYRDNWEEKRMIINRHIHDYALKHRDYMSYIDINPFFRYQSSSDPDHSIIDQQYRSSDLLHFSVRGYDLMGDILYDHIKAYADTL